jgi:hypothetical protein
VLGLKGLLNQWGDVQAAIAVLRTPTGDWELARHVAQFLAIRRDVDGQSPIAERVNEHVALWLAGLLIQWGEAQAAIAVLRAQVEAGSGR